jgi:hypothetical protein
MFSGSCTHGTINKFKKRGMCQGLMGVYLEIGKNTELLLKGVVTALLSCTAK